jgi:8-oxo-dGTP pyrophosphatase MutT (NUDIX family)
MFGKKNIIAGAVDPVLDVIPILPKEKIKPEPYLTLFRETFEETGLHLRNDFEYVRPCFVLTEETEQHPSIIYEARLNKGEKAVEKIFGLNKEMRKARGEKMEGKDIVFLDREELQQQRDTFQPRVQLLLKAMGIRS